MDDSGVKMAYKVMLNIAIAILKNKKNEDQGLKNTNYHSNHIGLLRNKGGKN